MPPLIWLLRMLLLSINIVSSFKALKPVLRKRRSSQEPKNLSSADRARRRAIKEQLVCWVVFIALAWGEKLADRTLAWIVPLYSQIKLVVLFFMLAWRSAGAQIIFKKVIKPLVLPYERPLDAVGYISNELIQLVVAALLFVPRRVGQWWQGKAREPDIPAIMAGLRSPHRPPLARTLASSIESAQARSDAEITKRFSRPIVTSQPEPASAPAAPKATRRRPPSTTSLSASISHRPTSSSVPFRPIRPTNSREHLSLSASTSRLPRSSNGEASSSRLGASTNVYPSLSASQGPSEVWGTSRASTSRPLVPSSSLKGKQREAFDPLAVPSPPSSSLHIPRHSLNTSTSPPVPIHLGRSSTAARNSLAIPQPPSPPPPPHSPPRAEAPTPQVPPTPAPPGAFHTSFAAHSPPRLPRPAAVVLEEQKTAVGSPRAKASSAIAGLAMELDGGLNGGLRGFGSAKKKARGAAAEVETGRKRARKGEVQEKAKPAPRKARRRLQESDEEEEEEQEDSADEYVEEAPKGKKPTSPRKRKAPARELKDDETSTETEDRVASRKLATSTRKTTTSTVKPTPSSSSRVAAAAKLSIPLAASRSRLSRSTRGALESTSTSAPTTDDDGEVSRPATSSKKIGRTGASSSTVVAPTRKARRVLGRAGQQEAEQEMEVDGVPVVVRRTAGRR
ncbi:hypothetical protein BCR35DRAFT_310501 [Leucosporidium creatinivorum]|uniref:TB2/DP1, HVA22 family-domain-containing protein n=1 Tax=Leucosporidium creatinivorum TaxID=106004 RepID=A0A1Y2D4C6_9BASI|nr:hypothetical protein BCR35DRAFT_310501 [Leucosporidium creatinivorum]